MRAILTRVFKDTKQTLGQIDVGSFKCYTLELPDLNNDGIDNNEIRSSCIPEGIYRVTRELHRKFGLCYRVHGVEGRSGILIHSGTYYTHTLGCILPATDQKDINKDGLLDNQQSRKALAKLCEFNFTELEVITI